MKVRRSALRAATLLAAVAFSVFVLELGVRLLAPQELIEVRPDIWIPDDDGLGWRQRDGLDTTVNTGERTVHLRTGTHGHRVGPATLRPAALRVLALGDSFTVGLQVEYQDLFTAVLERRLTQQLGQAVEVANTGVGQWGPSHYRIEADRELGRGPYDAVLLALFAGNDIEERRIDHFPPKQASVVHHLALPTSWTRRGLVEAFAYPLNDSLERSSHAFVLMRAVAWRQLMRLGLSARALPQSILTSEATSPRWQITADLVEEIVERARRANTPTVVCLIPGAYQVDPDLAVAYARAIGVDPELLDVEQPGRLLGTALAAKGIVLIDLLDVMRSAGTAGQLFGSVDTHLSPAGHRVVADRLIAPLETLLAAAAP